jgi:D-amino-acid oxidase
LEAERVTLGLGKEVEVVHAYGIGPAGFQASWGMAKEASDLVGEALMKRKVE